MKKSNKLILEELKQQMTKKYRHSTWHKYLNLLTSKIKLIYHQYNCANTITEDHSLQSKTENSNNYIPYIPSGCMLHIWGYNNTVEIDPSVTSFVANIIIGDPNTPIEGCTVKIGKNSYCNGANICLYESNSSVYIGEGCMFSSQIEIWASDSHSIINAENKKLLNWGKQIFIGNHVWIGIRAIILKNSYIANDCIVGAASVVSGKFKESNCILAGSPARVVKKGITWDSLRPQQYQQKYQ